MAHYLDTSALVKLVVPGAETRALLAWLRQADRGPPKCDLARTELLRAVRRVAPGRMPQARAVRDVLARLDVTSLVFEQAAQLTPPALRTLDALPLAAA